MRVVTLHRLLLAFWAVVAAVVVVRARLAPATTPRRASIDVTEVFPSGAALLLTADLSAWRDSELGRAIFSATPLGEVERACVGDPTAPARAVALAVPSRALAGPEAEVELGLAAVGDFDAAAVADCAAAIVRLHGGDPVRTTLGGFLTVRARGGASEGEVAARDGGPVLLSGGRYLRDMIDAAEGRSPSLRSEARHRALREAVGVDAALVVSWIAPAEGEALVEAVTDAPVDALDHVRAIAARIRLVPRFDLRVLLWCDTAAPCHDLARALNARLQDASSPVARAWLGFDLGQRARVTADGDRVTLAVSLEPGEARRLVELGLRAWSPRGADGATQQP